MSPGEAASSYRLAASRREVAVALLIVSLVVSVLIVHVAARAGGAEATRCERFAADSVTRARVVTGRGQRVVVIGDSYAMGLGLDAPVGSWPSRLPGEVHVAGFSGSGFSSGASRCGPAVSFAARAVDAVGRGADLVLVQGGLNDHDQPTHEIRAGFERLMGTLHGRHVVVVGPPSAPSRAAAVVRVDRLLAGLAERHGATYVPASGWTLSYLPDRLHLTPAGHRTFGDHVAAALADLV